MSIDDSFITTQLKKIWRVFAQAGITDDLSIIESIAFILIVRQKGGWTEMRSELWNYFSGKIDQLPIELTNISAEMANKPVDLTNIFSLPLSLINGKEYEPMMPEPVTNLQVFSWLDIMDCMEFVFDRNVPPAVIFDEYLITRIEQIQGGGRYPTPRHLTNFMAHLVSIDPEDLLADLACGSGGMLVAAAGMIPHAIGYEISPDWARLASANGILHELFLEVNVGNTFALIDPPPKTEFDCVLMNPPFGISIDPTLIAHTFGGKVTGRSETLFTVLAYEKLKPGGQMAVMVPSGVLYSNSGGESILRDILLEDVALKAVIGLPKDSSQPYSALSTHVLVAQKPRNRPKEYNDIWFYQARYDGYTSGRNRQPDSQHNDLPIIGTAVGIHQKAGRKQAENATVILAQPLIDNKEIIGYEFKGNADLAFHVSKLNSGRDSGQICFLAETTLAGVQNAVLVYQKDVYRSKDKEDITLGLPEEVNVISDLSFTFSDKAHQGLHLKVWSDAITFWRKDVSIDYTYVHPTKDHESLAFVIDSQGKLISPGKFIDTTCLKKRDHAYTLQLESQNEPMSAQLLVFPDYIHAKKLVSKSKKEAFMFQIDDSWGVFIKNRGLFILGQTEQCFESDNQHSGVLFDSQGEIIGVAVPVESVLNSKKRDLQPATYLPVKQIELDVRIPAQILANIKINQNDLGAHLDRLMGIAEIKAITKDVLPQEVTIKNPPIDLHGVQATIWNAIKGKVELIGSLLTPVPFHAVDIGQTIGEVCSVADIQRTIDLFVRMGLIVKVSYEEIPFYRLLANGDEVKGD